MASRCLGKMASRCLGKIERKGTNSYHDMV